jgi:3-hydroxyacyl-CoA dehydrogenase
MPHEQVSTERRPLVSVTREGDLVVLTVDNPPVNTINIAVRERLLEVLDTLESQHDVRGLVLLCAGNTFFSGADIAEFGGPPQEEAYRRLFNRLEALPIPTVAALHGTVMGGGVEIALAPHYRIALPNTRLAMPEVTLGIIPGAGGTQRMPRLIGVERTLELVLGAKPIDAQRALELGILDAIVSSSPATWSQRASRPGRPAP